MSLHAQLLCVCIRQTKYCFVSRQLLIRLLVLIQLYVYLVSAYTSANFSTTGGLVVPQDSHFDGRHDASSKEVRTQVGGQLYADSYYSEHR